MISDKEYLELVRITDNYLKLNKSKLVYKKSNGTNNLTENVYMDITSIDVVHDLVLKYSDFNFDELKKLIWKQIITLYWENTDASNPHFTIWKRTVGAREIYKRNAQDPEWMKQKLIYNGEYYKKHREQYLLRFKKYYSDNQQKIINKVRKYRLDNKAELHARRREKFKDPEYAAKKKLYQQEYYKKNKAKLLEKAREDYKKQKREK